jgi:hypothetical protein
LSNLLGDVAIRTIVLLLIRRGLAGAPIPLINLGIVCCRRGLTVWLLRMDQYSNAKQQTAAQESANKILAINFHSYSSCGIPNDLEPLVQ